MTDPVAPKPWESPDFSERKRRILGLSDSDRRMALIRSETGWPKKLDGHLIALLSRGAASVKTP